MPSIFDVARFILNRGLPNMTHKKLQKLCYYIQAWSLAVFGRRFMDCEFEAWVHGPVCKELYNVCKTDINAVFALQEDEFVFDQEQNEFMDLVLRLYGDRTGNELELLTHSEDPWLEARGNLKYWVTSNNVICDDTMATYYRKELN